MKIVKWILVTLSYWGIQGNGKTGKSIKSAENKHQTLLVGFKIGAINKDLLHSSNKRSKLGKSQPQWLFDFQKNVWITHKFLCWGWNKIPGRLNDHQDGNDEKSCQSKFPPLYPKLKVQTCNWLWLDLKVLV